MHHPHVELEWIYKSYLPEDTGRQSLIVKDVSLTVQHGEFVALYGQSGSGKSTLLNMIAGLEEPTAGTVKISGRDLSHFSGAQIAAFHRNRMGLVFQNYNLIRSLKVWENVALPQVASGVRYGLRRKRALLALKEFEVDQYADRYPGELSGGEQQRVAIARALINHPELILADEPTGNLDSESAEHVMRLLTKLHEAGGRTVILVTHNPQHVQYAQRVLYVRDGKIVESGKV